MKRSKGIMLSTLFVLTASFAFVSGFCDAHASNDSEVKYTGLEKKENLDGFELYYLKNGKKIKNAWKTVEGKNGKFKYYFGKNGKAYKASSFAGMRTTKVVVKAIKGKKYGFDENGHNVKGLWSTDTRLVFFNKKNGVYDDAKSKEYQQCVKAGRLSETMPEEIETLFGKPLKVRSTASCNPFDLKEDEELSEDIVKRYKGYNYYYDNFVISLTHNTESGIYHMDGAIPNDVNIKGTSEWDLFEAQAVKKLKKLGAYPKENATEKKKLSCLKKAFKWSAGLKYVNISKSIKTDKEALEYYSYYGFTKGKGDCNCQAATFAMMAKALGYKATLVRGYVPQALKDGKPADFGAHAWVTIKMGKKTYVFDPNFEGTHKAGWKFSYGAKGHYRYFSKNKKEI
ncbi:MAG: hypothetical protein IKQ71_00955 [Lachnospiraceae bacterium]|nr:hypothetical protein [Lachnospiraceae bacterium]